MVKKKVSILITGICVLFSFMLSGCGSEVNVLSKDNFSIDKIATFNSGVQNENGGTTEIIKYNKDNNKFYVINGEESKISIVSLDNLKDKDLNDGKFILVANEGEPRLGYGKDVVDPKGSVSIIDINSNTVFDADFSAFDSEKDNLIKSGIILNNKT